MVSGKNVEDSLGFERRVIFLTEVEGYHLMSSTLQVDLTTDSYSFRKDGKDDRLGFPLILSDDCSPFSTR
jgi:hypothetical protein